MAYDSFNGRRPMEYASKINHSDLIKSTEIKQFFESYQTMQLDLGKHIMPKGYDIKYGTPKDIKHIFAIDGSYKETFINEQFPSISLAFFNIGVLSLDMLDYDSISASALIDPSNLKKLKEVSKISFVIPTNNITKKDGLNFVDSVRTCIYDIFSDKKHSSLKINSLNSVLEWIVFEEWNNQIDQIKISCPNDECEHEVIFNKGEYEKECPACGKKVFLTDFLKLDKLITEPNGASGIVSFLCNTVEQLYVAEIIRYFLDVKPNALSEIVIIKDGPLAFFSKTFRLCVHYRNLFTYINEKAIPLYLVGLEKSGTFVEHALLIKEKLKEGKYYIFNEDYIKKYVEPAQSTSIYGSNTYYGKKVMYKTEAGDVLIAVLPVKEYGAELSEKDLIGAEVCLQTLSKLRCNMYDNSLVPIAIINKLVSIAELPSANILEKFSKQAFKVDN